VNAVYTPRNPPRSNADFHAFMERMVKAYMRRVGEGDIAALPKLIALQKDLDDAVTEAVRQLRHEPHSYSWAQIAEVVGVSRQACMQRWGHVGGSRVAGGQPSNLR
jgi:hypothetical protein